MLPSSTEEGPEEAEREAENEAEKEAETAVVDVVEPVPQEQPPEPLRSKLCCSGRLGITILSFFAIFNLCFVRVSLSMVLVCMRYTDRSLEDLSWSSTTVGHIISAAFYGFLVGPFLAGIICFKIGGKITLLISTFACSLLHFALPHCIRIMALFFTLRVFLGIFAGFVLPAVYDLFDNWIVPDERQLLVAGALLAFPVSSILNFPVNGFICQYMGWIWDFYAFGIWLILFGIVCIFMVYDTPEMSPFASPAEREYIKSLILKTPKKKIPWLAIFKSLPVYAYIIIHFCVNYVYLTMVFSLPLLVHLYQFSPQYNGVLSAIPFIAQLVMRLIMTVCFEKVRKKLNLSRNILRKAAVCLGSTFTSVSLLLFVFLSYEKYWVLICFALASTSLEICLTGGYLMSLLDLCPGYVNVLTGITNAIANSAGLICAVVNGALTTNRTIEDWYNVIYVNVSILMGAMIFYVFFGKNDIQYWALGEEILEKPISKLSLLN